MDSPIPVSRAALRRILLAGALGGTLIAGLLLVSNQRRTTMDPREASSEQQPAVPPIDADVPAVTKTVTFAMG